MEPSVYKLVSTGVLVAIIKKIHPLRGLPIWARYLAALSVVLVFFGLRVLLTGYLAAYPFLLFFPAILICAFLFDRGSGLLSVALSGLLALWFFVPWTGRNGAPDHAGLLALAVFVVIGFVLATLVEALRVTVAELSIATDRLRASDAGRALLLDDINHRIKNHLASIAGMLTLSARNVADVETARAEFAAAASRMAVLGRVYDRLHLNGDHTAIGAREFIEGLCHDLQLSIAAGRPIRLAVDADEVELSPNRAVVVGLTINELVQNALKYAFPDGREGAIEVLYRREASGCRLVIADDGIGLTGKTGGSGQRLVRSFARQLGGTIHWGGGPLGTRVEMAAPDEEPPSRVH